MCARGNEISKFITCLLKPFTTAVSCPHDPSHLQGRGRHGGGNGGQASAEAAAAAVMNRLCGPKSQQKIIESTPRAPPNNAKRLMVTFAHRRARARADANAAQLLNFKRCQRFDGTYAAPVVAMQSYLACLFSRLNVERQASWPRRSARSFVFGSVEHCGDGFGGNLIKIHA